MKVATIILNRNLPKPTDALVNHLRKYDKENNDIYVVEAGSDASKLSKNCTWHANTKEINKKGLRYPRGMNYGLFKILKEGKWDTYDAFFLLTNDTELDKSNTLSKLVSVLVKHKRVGILSPCSRNWGERLLIPGKGTKYFWYIHNNAYIIRKSFMDDIIDKKSKSYKQFLFDGSNFRGYLTDAELISKAHINSWAAAITTTCFAGENESYLLEQSDLIKTDSFDTNMKLYIKEGKKWIRQKYGFNSHWEMHQMVKKNYDYFFKTFPELIEYKI